MNLSKRASYLTVLGVTGLLAGCEDAGTAPQRVESQPAFTQRVSAKGTLSGGILTGEEAERLLRAAAANAARHGVPQLRAYFMRQDSSAALMAKPGIAPGMRKAEVPITPENFPLASIDDHALSILWPSNGGSLNPPNGIGATLTFTGTEGAESFHYTVTDRETHTTLIDQSPPGFPDFGTATSVGSLQRKASFSAPFALPKNCDLDIVGSTTHQTWWGVAGFGVTWGLATLGEGTGATLDDCTPPPPPRPCDPAATRVGLPHGTAKAETARVGFLGKADECDPSSGTPGGGNQPPSDPPPSDPPGGGGGILICWDVWEEQSWYDPGYGGYVTNDVYIGQECEYINATSVSEPRTPLTAGASPNGISIGTAATTGARSHKAILALTAKLPGSGNAALLKGGPAAGEDIILMNLAKVTSAEIDATLAMAAAKAGVGAETGKRLAYKPAVQGSRPVHGDRLAKIESLRALLSNAKLTRLPEFGNLFAIEIDLDNYR